LGQGEVEASGRIPIMVGEDFLLYPILGIVLAILDMDILDMVLDILVMVLDILDMVLDILDMGIHPEFGKPVMSKVL